MSTPAPTKIASWCAECRRVEMCVVLRASDGLAWKKPILQCTTCHCSFEAKG